MALTVALDVLGIIVCGGTGGVLAFAVVNSFGLDGAPGAFLAAILGMFLAVTLWAAGTTLLRHLRRPR
jgi:hypothetical protein